MPYLHLPVQSGSDRILKAMNRKHTAEHYLRLIERIRAARPDILLSSDFIVGFPGETDADFEATLDLIRAVGFGAAYSASNIPPAPARPPPKSPTVAAETGRCPPARAAGPDHRPAARRAGGDGRARGRRALRKARAACRADGRQVRPPACGACQRPDRAASAIWCGCRISASSLQLSGGQSGFRPDAAAAAVSGASDNAAMMRRILWHGPQQLVISLPQLPRFCFTSPGS